MPPSPRALYVAVAAGDALLAARGHDRWRRVTKPLLMPVLMIGCDGPTRRALGLGGVGDVALLGKSDVSFKVGLGSFLLGHMAWVMALRGRSTGHLRERSRLAAIYLAAWFSLNVYLWRRTGRNRLPVLVYSTALLATALAALDTGDSVTAMGGGLFLTSDTLIALERFADVHVPLHEGIVMVTYATAQALLAARAEASSVK